MARPTIKELYGLDATLLAEMKTKDSVELKIDKAYATKKELVYKLQDLGTTVGNYELIAPIQDHIKYLDRAIEGLLSDYEEMGLKYIKEDKR